MGITIGIDAREIQDGIKTGIGRALSVFLQYFSGIEDNNKCILFSNKPINGKFPHKIENAAGKGISTFHWDHFVLPSLLRKNKVDIFFSPYYKIPMRCPCKCVNTILDIMYLTYEPYRQLMNPLKRFYYRSFIRYACNSSNATLTCSAYSKSEIVAHLGIPPEKIKVVHLGIADFYKPLNDRDLIDSVKKKFNIAGDFILYVGNFKPHKNTDGLVAAYRIVRDVFPDIQLVMAGNKDRHFANIERLVREHNLNNSVIATGTLNEKEQVALYSSARVFVMPSFYEGFGYPALEAMACGTPVVSSNRASLPEVVGDAAIVVDPQRHNQIAGTIIKILGSSELANKLSQAGLNRVKNFSPEKTSQRLYELLVGTHHNG